MRRMLPAVIAAVLLAPAAAQASTTFGADLTLPADSTATCGNSFNQSSCLAYGVQPSGYAPFSGVVNTVRVKTGPGPTGPMQVVVLRSYYQNNLSDPGHPNFYCCFLQEDGPTFTPQPNTTTSVPATLGMVEDPTPPSTDGNTVAKGDFLALSVLSGTAVIPLSTQASTSVSTAFYAPAPTGSPDSYSAGIPGGQGGFGFTLLMNADIDPASGSTPAPAPAPAPAPPVAPAPGVPTAPVATPLTFGTGTARLAPVSATVPLVCKLTTACTGTLTLRDRKPAGAARAARAKAPVVLGKASFTIAAGKSKAVKVKWNAVGRVRARHHKRLVVYATSLVAGKSATKSLTLKG